MLLLPQIIRRWRDVDRGMLIVDLFSLATYHAGRQTGTHRLLKI